MQVSMAGGDRERERGGMRGLRLAVSGRLQGWKDIQVGLNAEGMALAAIITRGSKVRP